MIKFLIKKENIKQNKNITPSMFPVKKALDFLMQNTGRSARVKNRLLKLLVAFSFFLVCYLFTSLLNHQNTSLNPNKIRNELKSSNLIHELKYWNAVFLWCEDTKLGNRSCEVKKEVPKFTFPATSQAQEVFNALKGSTNQALVTYKFQPSDLDFLRDINEVSLVFPRSVQNSIKVKVGPERTHLAGAGIDVLASFKSSQLIEAGEISLEFDFNGFPWFGPADLPIALSQVDAASTYTSLPLRQLTTANLARQIDLSFPLMLAAVGMVLDHSYVFANLSIYAAARAVRSYIPFLTDNGAEWNHAFKFVLGISSGLTFSFLLFFSLAISNLPPIKLRWKFVTVLLSSIALTVPFFLFPKYQLTYDLWADAISSTLCIVICFWGFYSIFAAKYVNKKETDEPLILSNALLLVRLAIVLIGTAIHAYANYTELFVQSADAFKSALDWKHSALLPFVITAALLEVGSTARKLVKFGKEMATKAMFEKELSVGKEVQQRMLPSRKSRSDFFYWKSLYIPAQALAGDWYDIREISVSQGNALVLACVADVTGHGVGSSLSTSVICSHWNLWVNNFHNEIQQQSLPPSEKEKWLILAASQIHNGLLALPQNEQCTAVFVIVDRENLSVTFSTCGHPGVIIGDNKNLRYLSAPGDRLGAPDIQNVPWTAKTADLHANETLFLYSDGIVPPGDTITAFAGGLRRKLKKDQQSIALLLWKQIRSNRRQYRLNHEIEDDMTIIALGLTNRGMEEQDSRLEQSMPNPTPNP